MGKNFSRTPRCQICTDYVIEDFEHTLFVCENLRDIRQQLHAKLIESMPLAMHNEYVNMCNKDKLKYLLSGLSSNSYVPEWQDIYFKASTFIYEIYRARAAEYERLETL